jgi:hypothetical protein
MNALFPNDEASWLSCSQKSFKLFGFTYFDFERTWGMLFQKRVVHTVFYIYSTFLYFDKTIYNVLVARI